MALVSRNTFHLLIILIGIFSLVTGNAVAAKRVALVIGNSNYQNTSSLKNPVNDANLMARSLQEAGFEVTKLLDADYRTLKRSLLEFGRRLYDNPEAGLFYYAGHGVQVRGENYLIPVNAKIDNEDEIDFEAISVNSFLRVMNSSTSNINIVVLDACRNNPFARSFRSASRGLAPVDAPKGTYIAYATAPGDIAADGKGKNSPYTISLTDAMKVRGVSIEKVFKNARQSVLSKTGSKQVPWETSSITGDFYFLKKRELAIVQKPVQNIIANNQLQTNQAERAFELAKNSNDLFVLDAYINKYPNSFYASIIFARARDIRAQKDKVESDQLKALTERKIVQSQPSIEALPKVDESQNNEKIIVAKLEPDSDTIVQPKEIVTRATIREIQNELNRLGCQTGRPDGLWGKKSRRALEQFKKHSGAKLVLLEPSSAILQEMVVRSTRVCPLVCQSGFKIKNNKCESIKKQVKLQNRKSQKQTNRAAPIKLKINTNRRKASNRSNCYLCNSSNSSRKIKICSSVGNFVTDTITSGVNYTNCRRIN